MKKKWGFILAVSVFFAVCVSPLLFAEEMQEMGDSQQQGGPGMMGNGGNNSMSGSGQMRGGGGRGMNPMMMGMMGGKESVVATSDGGVVVLAGPKLMKYDRDLNLVKEVEIKKGKPGSEPGKNPQQDRAASESNGLAPGDQN